MPSIADLFVRVTGDVSDAITGLTNVDQKVNGTASSMAAAVPAGLALAGAAAVVGDAFLGAISTATAFEHQMSGVKAVMSPEEINTFGDALRALALTLGKDTVFTSSQAAGAIEELVKAGVSVTDILGGAASSALSLAAATGIPVEHAATIAAIAMNAFGLSADDLGKRGGVVDILAGTVNATAATMDSLRLGMSDTGSVAHLVGFSFEDTATAIGILNQQGLTANTAGTALKEVLINLQPATNKAAAEMKALGIITADGSNQFFDATGKVKSLADISDVLHTALAGMSAAQQEATLRVLFGTQGMQAAAIVATQTGDSIRTLEASIESISAADAAKIRLDNLTGALNQMGGSFETIQITIGSVFLPILTQLVQFITQVLNAFLTLDPTIQAVIVSIIGIAGALSGLLAAFILFGPMLGSVAAGFGVILAAVGTIAAPLLAIAVAAAVLYAAWQDDFGGIREVTQQVWEAIQPAFVNIQNFISAVGDTLAPMFAQAQTAAGPFIEQMSQALAPILAQLPGLVRSLGDEFNKLGGLLQQARGAFDQIGPVVEMVAQAINFLITGNLDRLVELMQEGLPQPFVAALQFIRDVITVQIQVWGDLLGGIKDFIGYLAAGDVQGAFNSLITTFGKIKDDILPLWNEFLTVLGGLIGEIGPFIADRTGDLWQALLNEFEQLPGQLQPYWDNFAGWLSGVLGGLPQFVADSAGDVWAFMRTVFENLSSVLQPAWDAFAGWLGAVVGGIAQFVFDNMGDIFGPLAGAFFGLVDLLAPAWESFAGWLGAVVGGIGQFIFDNMGDIWGPLVGAFFGLVDQLAPAWDAFAGWLGNVLAGLPQFVADHIGDVWGALIAAFTGSTPGTTTPSGGGTTAPAPAPVGGGITGPLISIGALYVGTVAEQNDFLQRMSDEILAAAQRLTTPPPASSPFLP